jgi:RNA polymerase sigma-70 factor (ECF subfamily)
VKESSAGDVTQLLKDWGQGDKSAVNKLIPMVYEELRKVAHRQMVKERAGHTLQTTALVNEVCLRFLGGMEVPWQDRAHFMALSAQLMRRILVDHARGRGRAKRGGDMKKVSLEEAPKIEVNPDADFERLDDALQILAAADARKSQVVELRFFGGFSVEETARILNISVRTVMNDWKFAKVWLLREMQKC